MSDKRTGVKPSYKFGLFEGVTERYTGMPALKIPKLIGQLVGRNVNPQKWWKRRDELFAMEASKLIEEIECLGIEETTSRSGNGLLVNYNPVAWLDVFEYRKPTPTRPYSRVSALITNATPYSQKQILELSGKNEISNSYEFFEGIDVRNVEPTALVIAAFELLFKGVEMLKFPADMFEGVIDNR